MNEKAQLLLDFFDRLGSKAKGMAKGHAFCFGSETIYFSHAGKPAQGAGDTGSPPAASGGPYACSGLARAGGLRNAVGWGLQQDQGVLPAAGRGGAAENREAVARGRLARRE